MDSRDSRGIQNDDDGGVVHEEDAMLDEFLEKDAASKNKVGGKRPQSAYQSYRASANYTSVNKFGESRKILEDGDEVGGTLSIKQR